MLIIEEKTLNEDCSTQNKNVEQHAFYSNTGRGRGRGRGQGQGGGRFGNQNFGQ
jgi:hypothetical protein